MTAQEQQMIQDLADRINNTPLAEKDPDAERFLQQALGRNPDALYILAQTVLVQQYALDQAQKQLADAKAQLDQQQHQQPKHATSFLGNLLGLGDDANRQPPPQQQQPNYPPYTPVQQYSPAGYGAPQQGYGPPPPAYGPPQGGGFLRSAMQTATGVAAGALAFEGIESLMHGFGGSGGSNAFSSGGGRPEEVVNNYYGDSKPDSDHKDSLSPDIEDRRHESAFDNAVDKDDHGKQGFLDNDNDTDASDNNTTDSDDTATDTAYDSSFDDDTTSDDSSFDNSDDNSF